MQERGKQDVGNGSSHRSGSRGGFIQGIHPSGNSPRIAKAHWQSHSLLPIVFASNTSAPHPICCSLEPLPWRWGGLHSGKIVGWGSQECERTTHFNRRPKGEHRGQTREWPTKENSRTTPEINALCKSAFSDLLISQHHYFLVLRPILFFPKAILEIENICHLKSHGASAVHCFVRDSNIRTLTLSHRPEICRMHWF